MTRERIRRAARTASIVATLAFVASCTSSKTAGPQATSAAATSHESTASSQSPAPLPPGTKPFVHTNPSFSVAVPAGWKVIGVDPGGAAQPGKPSVDVVISRKPSTFIVESTSHLDSGWTLDRLAAGAEQYLADKQATVEAKADLEVAGQPAKSWTYDIPSSKEHGIRVLTLSNDGLMTFLSYTSTREDFDRDAKDWQTMLNSFRFTN
jgi:hypothetical protein